MSQRSKLLAILGAMACGGFWSGLNTGRAIYWPTIEQQRQELDRQIALGIELRGEALQLLAHNFQLSVQVRQLQERLDECPKRH